MCILQFSSHWSGKGISHFCHSRSILVSLLFGKRCSKNWLHSSTTLVVYLRNESKQGWPITKKKGISSERYLDIYQKFKKKHERLINRIFVHINGVPNSSEDCMHISEN